MIWIIGLVLAVTFKVAHSFVVTNTLDDHIIVFKGSNLDEFNKDISPHSSEACPWDKPGCHQSHAKHKGGTVKLYAHAVVKCKREVGNLDGYIRFEFEGPNDAFFRFAYVPTQSDKEVAVKLTVIKDGAQQSEKYEKCTKR